MIKRFLHYIAIFVAFVFLYAIESPLYIVAPITCIMLFAPPLFAHLMLIGLIAELCFLLVYIQITGSSPNLNLILPVLIWGFIWAVILQLKKKLFSFSMNNKCCFWETIKSRWLAPVLFIIGFGCAITAAFRPFHPLQQLLIAAFYILFAWGWHRSCPHEKNFFRRGMVNGAVLIVSFALAIVLVEIGLRLTVNFPQTTSGSYEGNPKYIFLVKPNGRGAHSIPLSETESLTIHQNISSQGIRDYEYPLKAADEFRILMLGDSFTMGHGTELDGTIPKQLERMFASERFDKKISVINCGIGGGGPLQELGMLRERGLQFNPDLVILQLFLPNDIDNALEAVNKRLRAYDPKWHQALANWRKKAQIRIFAEEWIYRKSSAYHLIRDTTNKNWISNMMGSLRFLPEYHDQNIAPTEPRPFIIEPNLVSSYPELEEGWTLTQDFILKMRDESAAIGAPFIVYCIPCHEEAVDATWTDLTAKFEDENHVYERWKAIRSMHAFLDKESIPYFELWKAIVACDNPRDLYYLLDGHLNDKGNEFIAAELKNYLVNAYFPASGLLNKD